MTCEERRTISYRSKRKPVTLCSKDSQYAGSMLDGENHGNAQVCVSGGISDTGVNENRMMVLRYHDRDDKNQRVKYVTKILRAGAVV